MVKTIDLQFLGFEKVIAAYLVKTSEGPVLMDTGPHSTFKNLKSGIEAAGYNLSDVKHVFLSHIHFDHAGAAWAFAELGAKIYLHPVGAPHMIDPSRLVESAKRIYQDKMDMLWGQLKPIPETQMEMATHKSVYTIGDTQFISHHTPGHAIHHIAWQVGTHLFTGDVAGVSIEKGVVFPPCPPPDIHIEDWLESIALVRSLNIEQLYLSHFGKVTAINSHLDQLENILQDWANWMKPYAESEASTKEITPKFQAYVAGQLSAAGISEEGIQRYESANPSWMSVAGLMRYWKKKLRPKV